MLLDLKINSDNVLKIVSPFRPDINLINKFLHSHTMLRAHALFIRREKHTERETERERAGVDGR